MSKYEKTDKCDKCPFYDEGDFTPEGEPYCRGILDFGRCPYLYTLNNEPKERS